MEVRVVDTGQGISPEFLPQVGASLGSARQNRLFSLFSFMHTKQGSRNDLEDFQAQGFVKAIEGDTIKFDYRGINGGILDSVTPADLQWTCELVSRSSDSQLNDAFRAGGYTPEQAAAYVGKIREKIAQALVLIPRLDTATP